MVAIKILVTHYYLEQNPIGQYEELDVLGFEDSVQKVRVDLHYDLVLFQILYSLVQCEDLSFNF